MQKNLIIISILAIALLTGCDPHRIDIQQGNRIEAATLAKLKTGMNRKQILFILGSPLLKDPFHQERWDYIYYLKPGNDAVKRSRVTLFFEGDNLVKIDVSAFTPEVYEVKKSADLEEQPGQGSTGGGGHSH